MRRESEAILMLSEGIGVDVVARLVERATRTVMEGYSEGGFEYVEGYSEGVFEDVE